MRSKTTVKRPAYRKASGGSSVFFKLVLGALVVIAIVAVVFRGPDKGPYQEFVVDGKPTVLFLYSEPSPHHPYG